MYERILVPVDGGEPSTAGVDEAIQIARLSKGSIRLIHFVNENLAILGGYCPAQLRDSLFKQADNLSRTRRRGSGRRASRPTRPSSARTGGAASRARFSAATPSTSCGRPAWRS